MTSILFWYDSKLRPQAWTRLYFFTLLTCSSSYQPPNEDIRDPEIYSTFWGPILTSYDSVRVSKGFKMKLVCSSSPAIAQQIAVLIFCDD